MLRASPVPDAEEFAIPDYEGFEGISIHEHAGIDNVAEMAAFVVEHGKLDAELFTYYGSLDEARTAIEDQYVGQYLSLADFAQELTEGTTQIPETLRFYVDYERMARDMAISDIIAIETGFEQVHVFWSR